MLIEIDDDKKIVKIKENIGDNEDDIVIDIKDDDEVPYDSDNGD